MRYPRLFLLVGMIALVVFSSCGAAPAARPALVLYTWEDYIPDAVLADFTAETGIEVRLETFGTQPEAISNLQEDPARFDVLVSTGDIVGQLAGLRLVASLDHSKLPNLANIDARFLGWSWDPDNRYSAPYDWGTTGILYDTRVVAPPTSWRALAQHPEASRVGLDSDWLVTLGLTLMSRGSSLNTSDEAQLDAAADDIARVRAAGAPFMDSVDLRQAMIDGGLDMAVAYSGDAAVAIAANPNLAWVIPHEGADLYMDVAAVVAASTHLDEAHQLVNFFMRPDIQARITTATGYGNPNRESTRLGLNADDRIHGEIAAAAIDRLEPWQVLEGARQASWNRAWARAEARALSAR